MSRSALVRPLLLAALVLAPLSVARADHPSSNMADIDHALQRIFHYDRTMAVEVEVQEAEAPGGDLLFVDLPPEVSLHPSYDATFEFCQKFDPYNRSDYEVSDAEIDAYLDTLLETGPILEAFFVTGRDTREDLKNAWFRGGRGFEHVICGEKGRGSKLGGYHFWYMHYRYERDGRGRYDGADYGHLDPDDGIADTRIVTGDMAIDPDHAGGMPWLSKIPRGGFTVGHSVSAMLAAGHLAIYGDKLVQDADPWGNAKGVIEANLNGKTYPWTFHRQGNSLRTLWPRFVP